MTPTDLQHRDALTVLSRWVPPTVEQEALREEYVAHLRRHPDGTRRECSPAHLTCGALVLDAAGARVLLTLHAKARRWFHLGGHLEPGDAGLAAAALREATEEVGLDPAGVHVIAELPALFLPPSRFVVTPVLAWWHTPGEVRVADPGEVASVARVPVAELVDPDRRWVVTHPSGYVGPAFDVRGMLVWGFTAGLLDRLLDLGGLARPWDPSRIRPLPPEALTLAARTTARAAEPPEPALDVAR